MSIFHAYDIRGLYPEEITPEIVKKIGAAFIEFTNAEEVIIGRDMRSSCNILFSALCDGISSRDAKIIDIGLCSTPLFYFSVVQSKGAAGIMITASHNPVKYNGLKLMNTDATPIGETSGIYDIEKITETINVSCDKKLTIIKKDILLQYIEKLFSIVTPDEVEGICVAIDAGNGMAGYITPHLFDKLSCEMHPLYFELDGNFPNHEANPIKHETLKDLSAKIKETSAQLGVAFDGDADRVGFLDEKGEVISGDIITAILAREILREHKKGLVLYDVRSSRSVPEIVKESGGYAMQTRVGHALIKQHMKRENALFAGELSGHYYFNEFSRNESTEYAMLIIMRMLIREKHSFSEIVAEVKRYAHSGEINFNIKNKLEAIEYLKKMYETDAISINEIDGIRIDFKDWWFNVRTSNTEPKLRLNLEATTNNILNEKTQELINRISQFSDGS